MWPIIPLLLTGCRRAGSTETKEHQKNLKANRRSTRSRRSPVDLPARLYLLCTRLRANRFNERTDMQARTCARETHKAIKIAMWPPPNSSHPTRRPSGHHLHAVANEKRTHVQDQAGETHEATDTQAWGLPKLNLVEAEYRSMQDFSPIVSTIHIFQLAEARERHNLVAHHNELVACEFPEKPHATGD